MALSNLVLQRACVWLRDAKSSGDRFAVFEHPPVQGVD
jgi:hypothetical protein